MSNYLFVFGLDRVVVQSDILCKINPCKTNKLEGCLLDKRTKEEEIPFEVRLQELLRINLKISNTDIRRALDTLSLNMEIVNFIKENQERCYIITSYPDAWIVDIIKKINMEKHCICSKAEIQNDKILKIIQTDKEKAIQQLPTPYVAIGNRYNDAEVMIRSDIGIGFGGNGPISTAVLMNATHAVYEEHKLCRILQQLL